MSITNFTLIIHHEEGQSFEGKSCFDRLKGRFRSMREVAREVAWTLAAMANADVSALVFGIENDGTENLI
jgi:hypothetical protein